LKINYGKRVRNNNKIGRIGIISPKDTEQYHFKLILNRRKGAISFEDLRTYDNVTYKTYKETAYAMELVKDDEQIFKMFEEACVIMLPNQLRKYFVNFLLTENISGNNIWEKFRSKFGEDFKNNQELLALRHINALLAKEGMNCEDYSLPQPDEDITDGTEEINENFVLECRNTYEVMHSKLNKEQRYIFNEIIQNKNKTIFIDGPGGTGKTYLYKTLIFYYMSQKKKSYQ